MAPPPRALSTRPRASVGLRAPIPETDGVKSSRGAEAKACVWAEKKWRHRPPRARWRWRGRSCGVALHIGRGCSLASLATLPPHLLVHLPLFCLVIIGLIYTDHLHDTTRPRRRSKPSNQCQVDKSTAPGNPRAHRATMRDDSHAPAQPRRQHQRQLPGAQGADGGRRRVVPTLRMHMMAHDRMRRTRPQTAKSGDKTTCSQAAAGSRQQVASHHTRPRALTLHALDTWRRRRAGRRGTRARRHSPPAIVWPEAHRRGGRRGA